MSSRIAVRGVVALIACALLVLPGGSGSASGPTQRCFAIDRRASNDTPSDVLRAVRRGVPRMRLGIDTRNFIVEYVAALRNDFGVAARVRKAVEARCGARFANAAWGVG